MSSKAYQVVAADDFLTGQENSDLLSGFSAKARIEVESLAQQLFLTGEARLRRSVIFAEMSSHASNLWLTAGIAVTVARAVDRDVRVLHVERAPLPTHPAIPAACEQICAAVGNCALETVAAENGRGQVRSLGDRLAQLSAADAFTLIHLSDVVRSQDILSALAGSVDGIVLLVQENAVRKAAAENVSSLLRALRIPVAGVVLIDRTYPIPEPLYKRL